MHKRLWFRLLASSLLLMVLALGTAGFMLHRSATSSFEEYVEDVNSVRVQRTEALLSRYFGRRGEWTGVEPLVQQIGDLVGQQVVLADSNDVIIADSQGQLLGERVRDPWKRELLPIRHGDIAVGTLYFDPLRAPSKLGTRGETFLADMTRSLLAALGIGLLGALALSLVFARHLAQPLEALTLAVRRLEAGELDQTLETETGGEVGRLAEAFNSLTASLRRVEQLRQNMVSDIAHELRTPLTTIRGYFEAIQDGITDPTPEVLQTIHDELLQLTRLVDDLRDLALVEARQLRMAPALTAPHDLVHQITRAFAASAETQNVQIETGVQPNLPTLWVDPGRIGQVLRNVVSNALAHTPAGGSVQVRADAVDGQVRFVVEDTGPGIPAADLPHVFERFYRSDRSRSRRIGGAGLGLTIARELVLAHGGLIQAENRPQQGARLTVTLPVTPENARVIDSEEPRVESGAAADADRPAWLAPLRLAFYGFMAGALAGMVGGLGESLLVAAANRRLTGLMSIAPYAVLIDAIVVGAVCAAIAATIGVRGLIQGRQPSFRRVLSLLGPASVLLVGGILALKWSQLAGRELATGSPTATVTQVLILGGSAVSAAVAFAVLSTSTRWQRRSVVFSRGMVMVLVGAVGLAATIGVARDLIDLGFGAPPTASRSTRVRAVPPVDPVAAALQNTQPSDSAAPVAAAETIAPSPVNVVLITIDSLRADHLGAYGYEGAQTATVDRLAREGVRFDLAISPMPDSSPAHASIFTGTGPSTHRLRTNMVDRMAEELPTLAEVLAERGYRTAGLFSWFNFEPAYSGLHRGYQTYEDYTVNLPRYLADSQGQVLAATYKRLKSYLALPAAADSELAITERVEGHLDGKADVTTVAAMNWLEQKQSAPFFLWVHYFDPHVPYSPPSPYDQTSPTCPGCPNGSIDTIRQIRAGTDFSAPEINSIVRAYDGEVTFVDSQIGRLMEHLSSRGLSQNTLVVLVGSYGQSFGEHEVWLNGSTVYNSEVQVPLIMRLPGGLPVNRAVSGPVSLVDVMPTILDLTGTPTPWSVEGRSLLPLMASGTSTDRVAISETADRAQVAVLSSGWKLIRFDDGRVQLYHLPTDPDELSDRADSEPQIMGRLDAAIEAWLGAQGH